MNTRTVLRSMASAVVGTGLVAVATATALAASPSPSSSPADRLATIKARAATEVNKRETELGKLMTSISNAKGLTSSDRSTLTQLVQSDESGLTELNQKIQADTTVASATSDAKTIVTTYRVFALVVPKTHLVIAADSMSAAYARLHDRSTKIAAAIDKSKVGDDKKATAREDLADLNQNIAAAEKEVDGLSARVLALTPAGYPGNKGELTASRDHLKNARSHLAKAREDAKAIIALLKG